MRTAIIITGFLLAGPGLLGNIAFAQSERDDIEILRAQIAADRQAVVAANLGLPESATADFWPLYREYHAKRSKLMDKRVALLTEFRDNYIGLTAGQADRMLRDALDLEQDLGKLKRKYAGKFRKVLTARATLRYFQIENKLDTIVNFNLAQVVPLSN